MNVSAGGLTDAAGRTHDVAPDARILSLVPSLTETLFALGLEEQIVGRTAFCVHPMPAVKRVKSVGGTKQVNWTKVEAARPTHAVLNIDENPKEMARELEARGILPVVTHPIEPVDNGPLIRLLGGVFDRTQAAEDMAAAFEAALAAFSAAPAPPRQRVLYLIWKDPWMTVSRDTYIARLLALGGWQTVAHDPATRYPKVQLTDDLMDRTDRVLFSSEPFPFKESHLDAFRQNHPRHAAKALAVDGEMLSWYGARARSALDYLRDLVTEVPV